jgi:4-diphosphocytidyl-2-C-methyl-D-erythritol kinase
MVPLSLGDALTVSTAPPSAGRDTLRVTGLELTATPDNLVIKAIAAVRAAIAETWPGAPAVPPPLAARLAKRIPVAAGLGGGSSDAAATIAAALAAWSAGLSPEATAGGAALVTGRGEFVEPLADIESAPQSGEAPTVLLVTPHLPVATAAVFKAYAGGARPDGSAALEISERLVEAMRAGIGAADLQAKLPELARANDLMLAAASIAPGLKAFVAALEKAIGRPVCQSGSGPTLWSLYATLVEARKAVRLVRLAAVNGTLPLVGSGEPFVAATTIAGRSIPPSVSLSESTAGTIRPRTVHNGFDAGAHGPAEPVGRPANSNGEEPR